MLFARSGITLRGAFGTLGDFRKIFFSNIGEDQKKSHHLSAGPIAGTAPYYGKSGPSDCITFVKRLGEGLR